MSKVGLSGTKKLLSSALNHLIWLHPVAVNVFWFRVIVGVGAFRFMLTDAVTAIRLDSPQELLQLT
ncbi:hypothetical protein HMF3257_30770 [Spirosoma telluris]|uniref:Uncharacterized protein n=1 Tax=Spirosoma telluris TaxID=2183553 RepID=A0A327NQG9_9BACT|nr:hypothetical protein HMF3257_30770 [Spirosoma telluris]